MKKKCKKSYKNTLPRVTSLENTVLEKKENPTKWLRQGIKTALGFSFLIK